VGWRFDALGQDRALLGEVHAALRESLAVAAHLRSSRVPFFLRALRPWMSRAILRLAPRLAPFDLARYFRAHYEKLADQTAVQLEAVLWLAAASGLPYAGLSALRERLAASRALAAASLPVAAPVERRIA
jgi:hypothetical protein